MPVPEVRWRSVGVAVALTSAVVAAYWLFVPPLYLTNDDVTIRRGIEGDAFPGQPPTGFVLMTHSILGWTLVLLHRLMPAVSWWDLVLAVTLVAALGLLLALGWSALGSGWPARSMAVAALIAAVVPLVSGMQFTISVTLAGGVAVAAAMSELRSIAPVRRPVLAMSAVLLLTGLLIRPMGAVAGAIAVAVLLLPLALVEKGTLRTRLRPAAIALGATALLSGAVVALDAALYATRQPWESYHRYNWMAAQLVEWGGELPRADIDVIRAAGGWSENDWRMLPAAWGVDPGLHGIDRLSSAYRGRAESMTRGGWIQWLRSRLATFEANLVRNVVVESGGVFVIVAAVLAACGSSRAVGATALALALFCALCLGIGMAFKELPFRLLAPLQVCFAASALMTIGALRRHPSRVLAAAAVGIAVTSAVQQVRAMAPAMAADIRNSEQVRQEVDALLQLQPSLLILHSDSFPSEHWWRHFRAPAARLDAIQLGMNNQNPLLQSYLTATGRQALLRAACTDPSILVVAEPGRLEFVTSYFQEHFKTKVAWDPVLSASFRAWRCHPQSPMLDKPLRSDVAAR